ncbi:MAG TPA: tRNA (cytidine(34)-2'-O)-methyltransferase [Vulgatibacter sp.]|nr:tRNA (cytidine(34)-2'-O)-methyltransferase [Vulgatibacter sp.]
MLLPEVEPPLSVVLIHPQIPPNTGNVARLCAVTGARLHLVEPLGFSIADKDLRRAGLDYWDRVVARIHPDVQAWEAEAPFPRVHLFTAHAAVGLWEAEFRPGDQLVFGAEQAGLPPDLVERHRARTVGIPQREGLRSLNLSTAAGIALYEALRQVVARTTQGR